MTTEELFITALKQAPSPQAWQGICEAFDALWAQDATRAGALIDEASAALEAWPDHERVVPQAWFDEAAAGRRHAGLWLVRTLRSGALEDMEDHTGRPPHTLRALGAPELARVTRLDLSALGIQEVSALVGCSMLRSVRSLATASWPDVGHEGVFEQLSALEELTLHSAKPQDFLKALKRAGRVAELERLSLWTRVTRGALRELGAARKLRNLSIWRDAAFDDAHVAVLCEALKRAPLETLNIYNCRVTEASRQEVARVGWPLKNFGIHDIPWLKR